MQFNKISVPLKRFLNSLFIIGWAGFFIFSLWNNLYAQENSGPEFIPKKQTQENAQQSVTATSPAAAENPQDKPSSSAPATTPEPPGLLSDSFSVSMIVIGMLVGGFLLLMIEIAVIPGFGIAGLKGVILIFVALALAFWRLDSRTAVIYTILAFLGLIALGLWFVFIFPHTAIGKRFILNTKISVADGYTATQDFTKYVGLEGVAASDLRPSGIGRIADDRVDVMSEGDFIPRGTKIKVIKIKNGNIVVNAIEQPKA